MTDTIDKAKLVSQYSQLPLDSKYVRLVAHDVRNQVNSIMMATEMLREELKDKENNPQKYANMISYASEDILVILEAAVTAVAGREDKKAQEES